MATANIQPHGLGGLDLPIYNWPCLIDQKQAFLCEGERAVDRLADLGLVATCPPAGASSWRAGWSSQLWRSGAVRVYVLADRDQRGDDHAERVAAALNGYCEVPSLPADAEGPWADWPMAAAGDLELAPLRVKVIRLPGLPDGGDVVDYLDAGHGVADLLAVVEATPWWTPTLLADLRRQRKRSQTAARVRRYRARRAEACNAATLS